MPVLIKLALTFLLLGGFTTMLGIVVDTSQGYHTWWGYVAYAGITMVGAAAVFGIAFALILLWV